MAAILPIFRRAALRLAARPVTGQFLERATVSMSLRRAALPTIASPYFTAATATQPSLILSLVRSRCYSSSSTPKTVGSSAPSGSSSPLGALGGKVQHHVDEKRSRNRPNSSSATDGHTTSKAFAIFMLGSALSVFGIVVFGGLTRLTESGLSITQWKPVTGALPPRSLEDWESEFALYKSSPEYALLNPNMTLDEFKKIYFMEWSHRVWGRFIGLSYFAGLLFFAARRRPTSVLSRQMLYGASAVLIGIGAQGFVGWWMVSSGLTDDLFAAGSHPRVSHYRLAIHLAMAFAIYTAMFLMGARVLRNRSLLLSKPPQEAMKMITALQAPGLKTFRRLANGLVVLIFFTAMSGALVAGLDAGLIYNEFPMMGNGLAPPMKELFDEFYSRKQDNGDLWWRNLLENPSTVQLDHRILATTTLTSVLALFAYSRTGRVAAILPKNVKKGMNGVVHLTLMQVILGISTLIYMVPISLGALHQAGSLLLLTGALGLAHRLHVPKSMVPHIQKRLAASKKSFSPPHKH